MCNATVPACAVQHQPRSLTTLDKAMIVARCLDAEIEQLHRVHPDQCQCLFCYDSRGFQRFFRPWLWNFPSTGWHWFTEPAAPQAAVEIFLEQELGESCIAGQPLVAWSISRVNRDVDDRTFVYPPSAKKIVVLMESLDMLLWDWNRDCEYDCQSCKEAAAMRWLLAPTKDVIEGEINWRGQPMENVAVDLVALLAKQPLPETKSVREYYAELEAEEADVPLLVNQ